MSAASRKGRGGRPQNSDLGSTLILIAFAVFVTIQVSSLWFHEPWADEIQAFLLARDSRLWELLTERLKYEATPGLWHVLLWLVTRATSDVTVTQLLSVTIASLSAGLIFFASPFPWPLRLSLPFTYFLGYQYSIVARNYCLTTLGALLAAMAYSRRLELPGRYVLALLILAHSSAHGLLMAAAFALCDLVKIHQLKNKLQLLKWTPVFVTGMLASLAQFVPLPSDYLFSAPRGGGGVWSQDLTVWACFDEGFAGIPYLTAPLIACSLVVFYRCGVLLEYLLPTTFLFILFSAKHWAFWHSGNFFVVWLFCLYVSYAKSHPIIHARWWKTVLAGFLAVSVWQTSLSLRRDIHEPYFGLRAVAQDLQHRQIPIETIMLVGYYNQMLWAYYPPEPGTARYWVWSGRFLNYQPGFIPEYVLDVAEFTDSSQKDFRVKHHLGFSPLHVYRGTRPWKGRSVYSVGSFALYKRVDDSPPSGTEK